MRLPIRPYHFHAVQICNFKVIPKVGKKSDAIQIYYVTFYSECSVAHRGAGVAHRGGGVAHRGVA